MQIINLNSTNFKKEVLESNLPVLVDFWAEWCGPCNKMHPVIDELAHEYFEKVKFAKLNVDQSPEIASGLGIMSIPTFMFFKNGKIIWQMVGALGKKELKYKIDQELE